ncbi:MAG: hypothetical protein DME97_02730 [Verrucomicrobia bacterium]|nr:MAG: hypothetical protein DME97_02730 [Verrucomicrobiota bacterium]
MKTIVVALISVALMGGSVTAATAPRNLAGIPVAREALLRIVSPKFYRSLLISPVEGWIVARGDLANNHLRGVKVIHSELDGRYDALASELASNLQVLDKTYVQTGIHSPAVLVHLLIYQIADGKLAISFAHFDETGGNQLRYSGAAWMAVEKAPNRWVTIEPRRLSPHELRGPRTYTIAVETPNSVRSLRGNGPPPIGSSVQIQASPNMITHTIRER